MPLCRVRCLSPPCIESDHGVLVARSLILQEDEAESFSRVWRIPVPLRPCCSQTDFLSEISCSFSCLLMKLTPLLLFAGLRQSVQPAGHPTHRRHELQAAPRSLDVCNYLPNKTLWDKNLCCAGLLIWYVFKCLNHQNSAGVKWPLTLYTQDQDTKGEQSNENKWGEINGSASWRCESSQSESNKSTT